MREKGAVYHQYSSIACKLIFIDFARMIGFIVYRNSYEKALPVCKNFYFNNNRINLHTIHAFHVFAKKCRSDCQFT